MASAHQLEAVLDEMTVIPKHIIVDASRLTFIDSTGLRLLLRASNLVQGRIWIKGASRHVSRVLDVSGLSGFFCLEQDPVVAHRTIAKRRATTGGLGVEQNRLADGRSLHTVVRPVGTRLGERIPSARP